MTSLIDRFMNQLTAEEKSPETLSHYREELTRFEEWLGEHYQLSLSEKHIPEVTAIMLSEYYQELYARGLSVPTRNNYVVILHRFFNYMAQLRVVKEDASKVLRCVKDKKHRQKLAEAQEKVYTTEQIASLLNRLENGSERLTDLRDLAIVALILGSGMRASEVCSLNVSHADAIQDGIIWCKRKGGQMAEINVAGFVYPYVQRYLFLRGRCAPDTPLFISQKGNRMTRNALWKSFSTKQRELGLDTGVHRFRHTFLSDIDHHSNGSAALARDLGGHSSVAVTNNYLHTTPAERRAAVNNMSYASVMAE